MERRELLKQIEKEMPFLPKNWAHEDLVDFSLKYILANAGDVEEYLGVETFRVEMGILRMDHTWYTHIFDIPDIVDPVSYTIGVLEEEHVDEIAHVFVYNEMLDEEEPEEPDDRAPCCRCGKPISDVEYDDNGGYCNECCDKEK